MHTVAFAVHCWFGLGLLGSGIDKTAFAVFEPVLWRGSRRTRSPNRAALSFLLLGNRWVQGRGEGDVALIEDPERDPDPEGVEEEKVYPSVRMSASFPWPEYWMSGVEGIVENRS